MAHKIEGDAKYAMAWVESSVSLPLLAPYLFDRYPAGTRGYLSYCWDGDILKEIKRSSEMVGMKK